jgi:hypothetical protein
MPIKPVRENTDKPPLTSTLQTLFQQQPQPMQIGNCSSAALKMRKCDSEALLQAADRVNIFGPMRWKD